MLLRLPPEICHAPNPRIITASIAAGTLIQLDMFLGGPEESVLTEDFSSTFHPVGLPWSSRPVGILVYLPIGTLPCSLSCSSAPIRALWNPRKDSRRAIKDKASATTVIYKPSC